MKNFNNRRGISILIIIAIVALVLGGGYLVYKTQFANQTGTSGLVEDLKQAPGLLTGEPIKKNAPASWGDSLCDYYTLADAQAVLGSTAYLPKDGFTANVCVYNVPNGGDSFYEPSAGLSILYRSYSADYAKIMYEASLKDGAQAVSGVGEWLTVKANKRGGANLNFYSKGVLGGMTVDGFGTPEKNVNYAVEIARRVIPKLPQ